MAKQRREEVVKGEKGVAIYHCIYESEGFDHAAQTILKLVQNAQKIAPGQPRHLFLDILGHRNDQGGFDGDMFELQQNFLCGFMLRFMESMTFPLANGTLSRKDGTPQDNDIPDKLNILSEEEATAAGMEPGKAYQTPE